MKSFVIASFLAITATAGAADFCPPNVMGTKKVLAQTSPQSLIGVIAILPEASTIHQVHEGSAPYFATTWRYGLWGLKCRLFGCTMFRKGAAYGTAFTEGDGKSFTRGDYCKVIAADDVKAFK